MDTEVEQRIARLAQHWDTSTRPVAADEARSRPSAIGALDIHSVVAPVRPVPQAIPARRWIWMAAAASIVALVVAVAAIVREPSNGSISSAPAESTVPTTAAPDETAVTTPVVEERPTTVSDVMAQATTRLSALQSFRATATVRTTQRSIDDATAVVAPESTTVNDITLMADGSLWMHGDLSLWGSYDASTGMSRGAFLAADGTTQYQEIVGWTDNSTPLLIALGYDPVMRFDAVQDTVVEVVDRQLGRPAWRLTASFAYGTPEDTTAFSQVETYTIDQESGLIVEYGRTSINNGIEDVTEAKISDLQVDVDLPAEFPGAFPDGAVVDRSGNPDGFALLTPETASQRFGGELLLPAQGDAEQRIVLSSSDGVWGDQAIPVTNFQVTVQLRTGFVTKSVVVSKAVLQLGAPISDPGALVVDGALCRSQDRVTCTDTPDSAITSGALAGRPSTQEGRIVTATSGPVRYVIMAQTADDALATANSFS